MGKYNFLHFVSPMGGNSVSRDYVVQFNNKGPGQFGTRSVLAAQDGTRRKLLRFEMGTDAKDDSR